MTQELTGNAALEVLHPSGERTRIAIDPLPFRIGRGPENHLILRDNRASRAHATIFKDDSGFFIEDLDSLHGTWVNDRRIEQAAPLRPGDSVHFGFEDSYRLVFSDSCPPIRRLLDQLSSASSQPAGAAASFARLRALIEVARTLQTSFGGDEVLGAILDTALALTGAERGFLLLRSNGDLEMRVGRDAQGSTLSNSDLDVPVSQIDAALRERRDLLSMTLNHLVEAGGLRESEIQFRNVICVPLVRFRSVDAQETISLSSRTNTVGLLYLDSRERKAPLSELNRELLHTLALEASTVLENANSLEQERHKRVLDQDLEFARKIQQNLLPQIFPESPWFRAAGSSLPSAEIAGDYFDIHPIGKELIAAVIADVSGKGVSSALLASLLQGAFLLGAELQLPLNALTSKINTFLIDRAQREKYATLFCCTIACSGALTWVNAGHCAPFLVQSSGEIQTLRSTGTPLGLLRDTTFEMEQVQLSRGDKIIAYSDGLTEAENSERERFESKLNGSLKTIAKLNALETRDRLMDDILKFKNEPLLDDVTLLVLEYRGDQR